MTRSADVLVAGAGPAGLALALQAHDHGARVRIVERRPEAFRPSRALIMHPRTLEVLRPLGVTAELLARADVAPRVRLQLGSRTVHVRLADLALPDTAFPHLSLLRQMDLETVLAGALAERGVQVERGTELTGVRDDADADETRVQLRSQAGAEETASRFVAGCDGPASTVRAQAGIGWRGRPYAVEVLLADADIDGDLAAGVAHVVAGRHGLVFVFALGERAAWRLLMTRPASGEPLPFGQPGPPVPTADLQALLDEAGLDVRITRLAWSARVWLQHRLAARFRQGRLFLAGDAAHAHSPATGQGMNTGIQDAVNLGWKLAFAVPGTADLALLDSYDRERRPVAREVQVMTHLAFWGEASTGRLPSFLRGVLAPLAAPAVPVLLGRRRLVAEGIRLLSQLRVGYPGSPLSVEGAPRLSGGPRAGRRLPDATVTCGGRRVRLHELLARPGIHVLLHRDADQIENVPFGRHVILHRLTSTSGRGLVAVRPDGYVGFRCGIADVRQLSGWLADVGATEPVGVQSNGYERG
jgi:2-polyprenyl-6-methoxyphenol hydroxylase-like FAD-dependent oxidoreductase